MYLYRFKSLLSICMISLAGLTSLESLEKHVSIANCESEAPVEIYEEPCVNPCIEIPVDTEEAEEIEEIPAEPLKKQHKKQSKHKTKTRKPRKPKKDKAKKVQKGSYTNPETFLASHYKYQLPNLPYEYDALKPYIDTRTMKVHHNKHHAGYVNKLNKALENRPELQKYSLQELLSNLKSLPRDVRESIRHNGGGHFNHSFFWNIMSPDSPKEPKGALASKIEEKFGSFDNFKDAFFDTASNIFGSGWAWLSLDSDQNLILHSTKDQNTPLEQNLKPLLGLDVWEHAYYLKYKNQRDKYIKNWFNIINWPYVERLFNRYLKSTKHRQSKTQQDLTLSKKQKVKKSQRHTSVNNNKKK